MGLKSGKRQVEYDSDEGGDDKRPRVESSPTPGPHTKEKENSQSKHEEPDWIEIPGTNGLKIHKGIFKWLTDATTERDWKGASRAALLVLILQTRFIPVSIRKTIFEFIVPKKLHPSKYNREMLFTYFQSQFNLFFRAYKQELTQYAKHFLNATEAGKYAYAQFKKANDKATEGKRKSDVFVPDFDILKSGADIIELDGRPGLSFTKLNVVQIMRKQLSYFETDTTSPSLTGWFADDDTGFWIHGYANSLLKDMVSIIILELAPGTPSRKNNKCTLFGDQVWKNRFEIPDGTRFPTLAGLDARDGSAFFDHNAPTKECDGNAPNIGNSLHHYVDTTFELPPVIVDSEGAKDFGDGSIEDPITNATFPPPADDLVDNEMEEPLTHHERYKQAADTTIDYTDPDNILDENPGILNVVRKRSLKRETASCQKFVTALDNNAVQHPFVGESFDALVRVFDISSVPVEWRQSNLSAQYASSNVHDQAMITVMQIRHRQKVLAGISVKCDEDKARLDIIKANLLAELERVRKIEEKLAETAGEMDQVEADIVEAQNALAKSKSSTTRLLDEESDYGSDGAFEDTSFEKAEAHSDYSHDEPRIARPQHSQHGRKGPENQLQQMGRQIQMQSHHQGQQARQSSVHHSTQSAHKSPGRQGKSTQGQQTHQASNQQPAVSPQGTSRYARAATPFANAPFANAPFANAPGLFGAAHPTRMQSPFRSTPNTFGGSPPTRTQTRNTQLTVPVPTTPTSPSASQTTRTNTSSAIQTLVTENAEKHQAPAKDAQQPRTTPDVTAEPSPVQGESYGNDGVSEMDETTEPDQSSHNNNESEAGNTTSSDGQ